MAERFAEELEPPLRTRYRHRPIASRKNTNTLTHGFPSASISKWHLRLLSGRSRVRIAVGALPQVGAVGPLTCINAGRETVSWLRARSRSPRSPQNPHNCPLVGRLGLRGLCGLPSRCEGRGRVAVRLALRCSRAGAGARPPGAAARSSSWSAGSRCTRRGPRGPVAGGLA